MSNNSNWFDEDEAWQLAHERCLDKGLTGCYRELPEDTRTFIRGLKDKATRHAEIQHLWVEQRVNQLEAQYGSYDDMREGD